VDLSSALAARYSLRNTLVVRLIDGPDEFKREQLGRTCAELLTETLEAHDVLGISWGRTLHSMVGHLSRLPGCTVVQLVGSVPTLELDVNSMELVRRVAECAGGAVYASPCRCWSTVRRWLRHSAAIRTCARPSTCSIG